MAGQDRSTKDKMMAAHLKAQGIYHGKHTSSTNAPPVPNPKDVGTAKYRRYLITKTQGNYETRQRKARFGA